MPVKQYTAKLSEKVQLTDKYIQLYFEMEQPHDFAFQAGQYMSLGFPDQPVRRPYSIASSPDTTHGFELLIDVSPMGVGTKYLNTLPVGSQIHFLGPMGVFTLASGERAQQEQSLVFVATGSGIAPLRSMVLHLLQTQQDRREMWLYWGLRHMEDLFWTEDFHELSLAFPNFHFHVTLSQATQEWPLCRGRVTDCLSIHDIPDHAGFYLCGNKMMVEDVSRLLIEDKHIPKDRVHHEKFY